MAFNGLKLLGDLTVARTYAETKKNGLKENWDEIVNRYLDFMVQEYPQLESQIYKSGEYIQHKRIVPSMRLLQFSRSAGANHVKGYNCAYLNVDCVEAFRELPWLLSCGAGVGVGILKEMVDKLPTVPTGYRDFYNIGDTKEDWAYSIEFLMYNPDLEFGYDLIRLAGAPLSTGGTAAGSEPLRICHEKIREILKANEGKKLRPIHILHIVCHIATAIVSGGVRRSAIISLCSSDDIEVINAKTGDWFNTDIHLSKSNNSAVLFRDSPTAKEDFERLMEQATSGWGEPGVVWAEGSKYNAESFWGVNPCVELSLKSQQFCNLTEIIVSNCESESEFIAAAGAASFFGTLQAGLTEFPFLRPAWKANAEEDGLIGVSITGQALNPELMTPEVLVKAADAVNEVNRTTAKAIGINPAKRTTCVKPSGSTSAALGCTSGVHAAHSEYFIRRIRAAKLSPLGVYLTNKFGIQDKGFVEQCVYSDKDVVLSVPCSMVGAVTRHEGALGLLERMSVVTKNWVHTGFSEGEEQNNVSLTVSYTEDEKELLKDWMWDNKNLYRGISILSYSGEYPQAPFEEITKEKYEELIVKCPNIKVSEIVYEDSSRMQVAACVGGSCEVSF